MSRLYLPPRTHNCQQKVTGGKIQVHAPIRVGPASRAGPGTEVPLGSRDLPQRSRSARGTYPTRRRPESIHAPKNTGHQPADREQSQELDSPSRDPRVPPMADIIHCPQCQRRLRLPHRGCSPAASRCAVPACQAEFTVDTEPPMVLPVTADPPPAKPAPPRPSTSRGGRSPAAPPAGTAPVRKSGNGVVIAVVLVAVVFAVVVGIGLSHVLRSHQNAPVPPPSQWKISRAWRGSESRVPGQQASQ